MSVKIPLKLSSLAARFSDEHEQAFFDAWHSVLDNAESLATDAITQSGIKLKTGGLARKIDYDILSPTEAEFSFESSYAGYLDDGFDGFDMKCLVDPRSKVFTSKGLVMIKNIRVGDLVLTHKGEFKRVLQTFVEKNTDEYVYRLRSVTGRKFMVALTGNHPVLTNRGWKRVDALDAGQDLVSRLVIRCSNPVCDQTVNYRFDDTVHYCSRSCAAQINNGFRRGGGRPDLGQEAREHIGRRTSTRNRKLYAEGRHPIQSGKLLQTIKTRMDSGEGWGFGTYSEEDLKVCQKKASIALGKASKGSMPEEKLASLLEKLGMSTVYSSDYDESIQGKDVWIRQYMVKRSGAFKLHRGQVINKWYFLDFYNPLYHVCIEVNGERYHTEEQDTNKKLELERDLGLRYLSFWAREVCSSPNKVEQELLRVLNNHEGNYQFAFTPFSVEKIQKPRFAYFNKYNLMVEGDSSFVVQGLVVHNSGMLKSPKAKVSKDGFKYARIPIEGQVRTVSEKPWTQRKRSSTGQFTKGSKWQHPGVKGYQFSKILQDSVVKKVEHELSELDFEEEDNLRLEEQADLTEDDEDFFAEIEDLTGVSDGMVLSAGFLSNWSALSELENQME